MGDTSALVVENTSLDHILKVEVEMTESSEIRSSRNSTRTIDWIPPNHRQLLFLMEDIDENTKTIRSNHPYSYKYQHTLTEQRQSNPMISRADDIHAPRPIL